MEGNIGREIQHAKSASRILDELHLLGLREPRHGHHDAFGELMPPLDIHGDTETARATSHDRPPFAIRISEPSTRNLVFFTVAGRTGHRINGNHHVSTVLTTKRKHCAHELPAAEVCGGRDATASEEQRGSLGRWLGREA